MKFNLQNMFDFRPPSNVKYLQDEDLNLKQKRSYNTDESSILDQIYSIGFTVIRMLPNLYVFPLDNTTSLWALQPVMNLGPCSTVS
jgi:hypothetical protein